MLTFYIAMFLGILYDYAEKHLGTSGSTPCLADNHIMSRAKTFEKWSSCSKADFEAHYLAAGVTYPTWCMEGNLKWNGG